MVRTGNATTPQPVRPAATARNGSIRITSARAIDPRRHQISTSSTIGSQYNAGNCDSPTAPGAQPLPVLICPSDQQPPSHQFNYTSGGKTYTFKIRTDVKFHDGKPLNAEDVVFSVKRITNPAFKSPQLGQFNSIVAAEIVALPRTVSPR